MKKEDRQIEWQEVAIMDYTTFKAAKRGAERFLKRLQEAVK